LHGLFWYLLNAFIYFTGGLLSAGLQLGNEKNNKDQQV